MGHFTPNHHIVPTSENVLPRTTTLVCSTEQAPLRPDLLRPKSHLQTPYAAGKAAWRSLSSQLWGILGYPGNEAENYKGADQQNRKKATECPTEFVK